MFWGRAMASPSTVIRLDTSGMPVFRYLPRVDTEVTFMTMQPTSAGRPGLPDGPTWGTSRPVQVSTRVFSAPWGVAHRQRLDRDALELPGQRAHQVDAGGLVALNGQMRQCGILQYFITARMPASTVSLHSSISRASVVR